MRCSREMHRDHARGDRPTSLTRTSAPTQTQISRVAESSTEASARNGRERVTEFACVCQIWQTRTCLAIAEACSRHTLPTHEPELQCRIVCGTDGSKVRASVPHSCRSRH